MKDSKILETRKQVDEALSKLANFPAPKKYTYEYLLFVDKIMDIFNSYEKALAEEEHEDVFTYAEQILSEIELESNYYLNCKMKIHT